MSFDYFSDDILHFTKRTLYTYHNIDESHILEQRKILLFRHEYGIHLNKLDLNDSERKSIDIIQPIWYVDVTNRLEKI